MWNFLLRHSLHRSNVDDEFWDVSGHYLTERKEAGVLKKAVELRLLFPVLTLDSFIKAF